MNPIFSIGHSTHPTETFIGLLQGSQISVVADVRSSPYSRFNPQFNRETLVSALQNEGVRYVFLGEELGARSEDPSCYVDGRVQYDRLARTESFRKGLERLRRGAQDHRIALMCAEKDPLDCHRTLLVAHSLVEEGEEVLHILKDGSLESHTAAMDRLLGKSGLPQSDLFRSREELLAEAMDRQERRIAYADGSNEGDLA